jgi:hypothetical protein
MPRLGGCLTKLILLAVGALMFVWAFTVALHPWALHIGGRSTPLLYWQGTGTVLAKSGKTYPLYVSFFPWKSGGTSGGGRREGKLISGRLRGTGWLCIAPGQVERMNLSGAMYGGFLSTAESLFEFRLLEWRSPFAINPPRRGFFDLGGRWRGPQLVMDSPREQGIPFNSKLFIDNATATLSWASYQEFESACRTSGTSNRR